MLEPRLVSEAVSIASDCINRIKVVGNNKEQIALIGRLINDAIAATQPRNIFETMASLNEARMNYNTSKKRK